MKRLLLLLAFASIASVVAMDDTDYPTNYLERRSLEEDENYWNKNTLKYNTNKQIPKHTKLEDKILLPKKRARYLSQQLRRVRAFKTNYFQTEELYQ